MSQKKWVVRSKRLLWLSLTLLFTDNATLFGAKYPAAKRSGSSSSAAAKRSCCTPTFCEVPCRTFRDGSSVSTTDGGSSGGSSTSDSLALADAPFGVTKVLRQCDFKPSYTIKCPGTYVFGEPIRYQGTQANDTTNPLLNECALIIDSDDVTVDLNGYSLTYMLCNKPLSARADNVSGICIKVPDIAPLDRKNVTIRNGAVRYFTGNAIQAIAQAGESIEYVIINEVIANNNKFGMLFRGNATSGGLTGTDTISSLTGSTNALVVNNVRILQSTASFNDNGGILFDTVSSSEIVGTTTNNNGDNKNYGLMEDGVTAASTAAAGTNTVGIDLQNSRRLSLKDNNASLNYALNSGGSSHGIYLHTNGTIGADTIESVVDRNKTELNNLGFQDDLTVSSTVYTRNIAINNGGNQSSNTKNGSGNYTINFGTPPNLRVFTNVAALNDLHEFDNTNTMWNYSIGIVGQPTDNSANAITPAQV